MKNVVVTIIGTQKDEQKEESRIELITLGRCYSKNGVNYILYKDSEISGLEGVTTMLKVYDKQVTLVRTGSVEHKQDFRLGEKSRSAYVTPYGTMQMSIVTNSLEITSDSITGIKDLDISYELEMNGQWQSANTLSISIREESKRGY
ncbi:DUF1934 domain-containing protein [Pelosinus sp. UFO1]|uniref:DUF1934 domain-containing protein n=1 Tax=Pelosinus sp. UFO1 TaxID=484770 RepID=UPI0004D18FE2|nr:DUF1934 domain-containing protein [Pelosinus sp. UFO1]AIF50013.1 protein of unknown function DUF1934 [Pelosinus sp. UFO1]